VACIAIMFLINVISTVVTISVIFSLYWVVVYRKPDVNWGSSTQAQVYKTALTSAFKLQNTGDHVKNYRPQILVLSGAPTDRPPLIDFANLITKQSSLLLVGNIMKDKLSYRKRQTLVNEGVKYLKTRKIRSFYSLIDGFEFEEGARAMIQSSGFGKLTPNIVLLGYKSNWRTCKPHDLDAYFNVLQ
jgi:solute carrier family 12 sodium/potassium/chloride transporter 2